MRAGGGQSITDPEVRVLACIAGTLEIEYASANAAWAGSPFAWIRALPSRKRGKVGEQLLSGWLAARDFGVVPAGDSEADRLVNGRRVEIKFSTRWHSGIYKFQQIRDQRYEYVLCLGICPFDAHLWVIPKRVLMDGWRRGAEGLRSQHGGRSGTDTAWLSFAVDRPPSWLRPYGGSLAAGRRVLAEALGPRR